MSALIFSAAGCHTVKAPKSHDEEWITPEWEKTAKQPDPQWSSIRGDATDTSKPLTPARMIDIALANNPDTQKAWNDARSAEASVWQAKSAWSPKINVAPQLTRDKTGATNELLNNDSLEFGPQVQATYLLFDFGGRDGAIAQAAQNLLASNYKFNQALQDLIFNVASSYYSLYSAHAEVEAAEADVRDTKTAFDAASQKLEAGLVTKLDVLQAQSDYQTAIFNLDVAKLKVKSAHADLAKVLRFPADKSFEIVPPTLKASDNFSKVRVKRLINEAMKLRPDIAAARSAVRAKEAAVKTANSALWPSLNLGSTYYNNMNKYYFANSVERYGNIHDINGFVSVNWDIFDGFSNLNKKRAAQADLESSRSALVRAELDAAADVWVKYYTYKTAKSKLKDSEALLKTATESHDLALEGYNAGLKNILDLLQAQSSLSSARSKVVQSRKDVFISLTDLARSIGWLTTKEAKEVVNAKEQREPVHIPVAEMGTGASNE